MYPPFSLLLHWVRAIHFIFSLNRSQTVASLQCLSTDKLRSCPLADHHSRVSPHPYLPSLQPHWHMPHALSPTQFCQNVLVRFKNQLLKVFKLTQIILTEPGWWTPCAVVLAKLRRQEIMKSGKEGKQNAKRTWITCSQTMHLAATQ